ncbi:tRNA (adenosine(37)-N6)-threonylcarbamoyltransferase complex dimerization subunit type 1 TsaB, partial [Mycobacterium sp. ITM-2017-0098]
RDAVRVDGPAVNAAADVPGGAQAVAGSPEHTALFDVPRLASVYPTAAGLVAAVTDWEADPEALVPLYLRRPDAKPQVQR